MFFPIRCVFWLTIVFTTIFSQDEAARRTAPVLDLSQTVQSVVARALGRVETRLAENCTRQPVECLGMAAKMSEPERLPQESETLAAVTVPLPPPRPNSEALRERIVPPLPRVEDLRLHYDRPNG